MCKLFIAVTLLAIAVYANSPAAPSSEETESKLKSSGMSDAAIEALEAISKKYKPQIEAAKGDKDAMKKVFDEIKTETDAYMKTASAADQTAYAKFVEEAKAKMEAHHTSPATH